ncbi:TraR/DksA family transcriptional regulator [Streptomyces sp. NPDC057302]|uniref:TraR/DksA family transcriptional regulator n=1 Tax=Streptomyces sp. NPDC057302 TaxID=3346094 RepID=UPI00364191A9
MSLDTHSLTPPAAERPVRLTAREARRCLEHERDSRLAQLRAIGAAGHGQEAQEQVVVAAQRDTVERVLKEIDAALDRVGDGSYGNCPGCSGPIPVERLEILPYTRFCVPCQRRTD